MAASLATEIRGLRLPSRLLDALVLGTARTLNKSEHEADLLLGAVIGKLPTFGDCLVVDAEDVERKAEQAEINGLPAANVVQEATLLQAISPTTTVCNHCGEIGLKANGTLYTFTVDEACPFCRTGHFELVPMTLRRLHWVTGALVVANLREDTKTIPKTFIPLTDEAIKEWVEVNSTLDRASEKSGVPLYALLAVMHLRRHAFERNVGREAQWFLESPSEFGVEGDELDRLVNEAARLIDAREVTNLPHKTFLTDGARREDFWPLTIGDRTYLVEGRIGRGDKCDVFRARWDHVPTEFVNIKLLTAPEDEDLLRREAHMLAHVRKAEGVRPEEKITAEFMRLWIPRVVQYGTARVDGRNIPALVLDDKHQHDWSLREIINAYGRRLHPRHAIWMTNRILELLNWLHSVCIVHGAIMPEHIIIKTLTHRAELIDWSYSGTVGSPLVAFPEGGCYPIWPAYGDVFRPEMDTEMACRIALELLGYHPGTGAGGRTHDDEGLDIRPLVDLLFNHAGYPQSHPTCKGAGELKEAFRVYTREIYGPPRYMLFTMPPSRGVA